MEKSFIVFCQHNTGHGLSASIILLTADLQLAIDTANKAESLGYEFFHSEPFIAVAAIQPDQVYTKAMLQSLDITSDTAANHPIIYYRLLQHHGKWKECWCNNNYERIFKLQKIPT